MNVTDIPRGLVVCALAGIAALAGAETPSDRLELPPGQAVAELGSGSIYFVGNATVILRYGGITVLTDPNFLHKGDHVHLGYGLKSRRRTDPAIRFDQLPPIDFVLLSHYHGDHFDQLVEEKLARDVPIVTTPGSARRLEGKGFEHVRGLETWETLTITKATTTLRVTAMPGRHGPPVVAAALPDTMGSMLEFGASTAGERAFRLYISGDTLVHEDLEDIPRRYAGIDLALLHLGGTRVLGILVTMDATQGVEALRIIDPGRAIPIHYDDYDVFKSTLAEFQQAVRDAGLDGRVEYLARGDTYRFDVGPRATRPPTARP
jgi:L-ascorbate metabolism protein UlaG (beta-lactamase superfamily)